MWGTGFEPEDVENELRESLLLALRRCRWTPPGRDPGTPLVWYALRWKINNLWRTARRRGLQPMADIPEQEDPAPGQAELIANAEHERELSRLAYELRRRLRTRDMALLHLRYVEGLPRAAIAQAAQSSDQELKTQLETARARAAAFLRELGIATWEDVEHGY